METSGVFIVDGTYGNQQFLTYMEGLSFPSCMTMGT